MSNIERYLRVREIRKKDFEDNPYNNLKRLGKKHRIKKCIEDRET